MRVAKVGERVIGNVRESLYQDLGSGRTWSIYQTIDAIVIPIKEVTIDTVWDAIRKELD